MTIELNTFNKYNDFYISEAYARVFFNSLNSEIKHQISLCFHSDIKYITKSDKFWGNAICKKLYENINLVTEYYGCLLSQPKKYQYVIRFINSLHDLSYSDSTIAEAFERYVLESIKQIEEEKETEKKTLDKHLENITEKQCEFAYTEQAIVCSYY